MPGQHSNNQKGVSRRTSANASRQPVSSSNPNGRNHRSNESQNGFHGSSQSAAGMASFVPSQARSPQEVVVIGLIKRLIGKLPYYSGSSLVEIESDPAITSTIQSLAEFGCHSINIIVWTLNVELEKLTKNYTNGDRRLEVMQSQLFLLKVIAVTITYRWQNRKNDGKSLDNDRVPSDPVAGPHESFQADGPSTPSPTTKAAFSRRAQVPNSPFAGPSTSTLSLGTWLEAPSLDEHCARWLISVITIVLRQTSLALDSDQLSQHSDSRGKFPGTSMHNTYGPESGIASFDASLYGFESAGAHEGWQKHHPSTQHSTVSSPVSNMPYLHTRASNSQTSVGSSTLPHDVPRSATSFHSVTRTMNDSNVSIDSSTPTLQASHPLPIPRAALSFQSSPRAMTESALSMHCLNHKWAGIIVYLVSASNWTAVLARVRSKIDSLTQDVDIQDTGDLCLIHHCAMDRGRLIQLLQEMASLLLNMKKEAQATTAVSLRMAIWNWVEVFPHEFVDVATGKRKLDGAPERLYDILYPSVDNIAAGSKNTMAACVLPVLTLFIALSHERCKQLNLLYSGEHSSRGSKERALFDFIRKTISTNSPLSDVSLLCSVEMCKIASRVNYDGEIYIRSWAPDVCDDIKVRLWKSQSQRPFYETADQIDVALYAEAIVAAYRFLPEEEAMQIISMCLEPERSPAVKLCVIKAIMILVIDAPRIPSQPPLSQLLTWVASRILSIFRASIVRRDERDSYGNVKRISAKPCVQRSSAEVIADKELLPVAIFALYRVEPRFFLFGHAHADIQECVIDTVSIFHREGDPAVRLAAVRSFMEASRWMISLSPEDEGYEEGITWLGIAIPAVLLSTANRLLDARENFAEQRVLVEMAYAVVSLYSAHSDKEKSDSWRLTPERVAALNVAEVALLVTLISADTTVVEIAAKSLREIAIAERMPNGPINDLISPEIRVKRYTIYDQLGHPKINAVGRIGQQKRIRKLLRVLSLPCPMHVAVWKECYWRWSSLEESVIRRTSDGSLSDSLNNRQQKPVGDKSMSPEERLHQWQNLTLFLSSFGGASAELSPTDSCLNSIIPAAAIPDRFQGHEDLEDLMRSFVISCVDFLIADSVHAREVAKEALGSELGPHMYGKLFKRLHEEIDELIKTQEADNTDGQSQDDVLALFEQFMIVLKLLADRMEIVSDSFITNPDVIQTIIAIAKFTSRFNNAAAFRIKTKICSFCVTILDRRSSRTLRGDDVARNTFMDLLMGWLRPEPTLVAFPDDGSHNEFEMNVAILNLAVRILENLRLQPLDGYPGNDTLPVISRRFAQYQKTLLRCIKPVNSTNVDEDRRSVVSNASIRKVSVEKESEARELVITALSHMLYANQDVGLKHCLPLGYDQDPSNRAIFCHVLSRTLGLGVKFELPDRTVDNRKLVLRELIRGNDLTLALVVCEICPANEVDTVIPIFLNLFDNRASITTLLKAVIEQEIRSTTSESALFRGNSMRVRLLGTFAKFHGYDYLRKILKPLIEQLCDLPDNHTFELDPSRAEPAEIARNQETITVAARAFLNVICSSARILPPILRELGMHISQTVAQVWPESKFTALGAFLFLRFISPALSSPDTVDIDWPQENTSFRRGLVTITKIIQGLANNMLFGKEKHMMHFNSFLSENIVRVTRYLSEVNKYAATDQPDEWNGGTFDETDAIVLHRFLDRNADRIGKELLSLTKPSRDGEFAAISGKKAWNNLCVALVTIGPVIAAPVLSTQQSDSHQDFTKVVHRNINREVDSVRDLFVPLTRRDDRTDMFLVALGSFDVEVLDFELLVYHILKTLTSVEYEDRFFEFILDCTTFSTTSEIPVQWFKFFLELLPKDVRSRFLHVHILNANGLMLRYIRRLYNICAATLHNNDIKIYASVSELHERLGKKEDVDSEYEVLPEGDAWDISSQLGHASELERETTEVFSNITLRHSHLKINVTLAVAQTHLRITSVRAQTIISQLSGKSVEIIPYADVADVYSVSTGRDVNEFVVRSRNGGTLYFSSADRDQIAKAIRIAKARMKNTTRSVDRFSKLSNVSATVLNMGLLNISHEDPSLRSAAFQLLTAVVSNLNLELSFPLPSSKIGFIPGYASGCTLPLSEKFASAAPQLTLDFIGEVSACMDKCTTGQKIICLQYLRPWIKNLDQFSDPTSELYKQSGTRLHDCIKALIIDVTLRDQDKDKELASLIQSCIWSEMGQLQSSIMSIALDELARAAVDGGIGSRRFDVVAESMVSMSCILARSRMLSKTRQILSKLHLKPAKTLPEHPLWSDLAVFLRLVLSAGYHQRHILESNPGLSNRQMWPNQMFVSDIAHLVTLLAGIGQTSVRVSVHGLASNLLHSLYVAHGDGPVGANIRNLLEEVNSQEKLHLFGLAKMSISSEYLCHDPQTEQEAVDTVEELSLFMQKVIATCSGSVGLSNIWQARWMSLLIANAFQLSPSIQPRASILLGTLATRDMDDDLLYQMLVSLSNNLRASNEKNETETTGVVNMTRCIANVLPGLPAKSRYLQQVFWLAVAFVQSSHVGLFQEATRLLCASVETLHRQGIYDDQGFVNSMLEARLPIEEISIQLDQLLEISFETDFSLSLAAVLFKGIRRPQLRPFAVSALRGLLKAVTQTAIASTEDKVLNCVHPDALGYFLALLPVSTTSALYQQLLAEACLPPDPEMKHTENFVPHIPFGLLGCTNTNMALLVTSSVGSMLSTAQGDDFESQILYNVLADAALLFPEAIYITFETIQSKIYDTFTNSSNSAVLSAVSTIFRVAMDDPNRSYSKGSSSTLGTVDEASNAGAGAKHLMALEELNMKGIATAFQFLTRKEDAVKCMNWLPELIDKIIN